MDNPPIKSWMKREYDPFEGSSAFRECSVCKEGVAANQFFDNIEYASSVCNNCLNRHKANSALLEKFVTWGRTTKGCRSMTSLGTALLSAYSAPEIEKLVLSAIIHKAERKTLIQALLKITEDSGDQLLLTECMEELSNLQDENEAKEK